MQEDHKVEAQKRLGYLRSGTEYYNIDLRFLRTEVQECGFTLQDIGTSEEELKELRVKSCKISVQKLLDSLRRGINQYDYAIQVVRGKIEECGFTLQDIGTSEEELKELRVKSCKILAQKWLERLRSGTDRYDFFLEYLYEEVQKGGFTLQDIGTSEEELKELRPATAAAKKK